MGSDIDRIGTLNHLRSGRLLIWYVRLLDTPCILITERSIGMSKLNCSCRCNDISGYVPVANTSIY